MSSSRSAALLRVVVVDVIPLAFLTDAWQRFTPDFSWLFVFKTACLGSIFGEPPLPLPVSAVETCTSLLAIRLGFCIVRLEIPLLLCLLKRNRAYKSSLDVIYSVRCDALLRTIPTFVTNHLGILGFPINGGY